MGWRFVFALVLATPCCRRVEHVDTRPFTAPEIGLSLPHLEGWARDPSVKLEDVGKGGVVMRLVRQEHVAGMPRVDVIIEPVPVRPTFLEDVLSRALHDMADLEERGTIDINALGREPMRIGPRRGFRVTHSYVVHADEQTGITQTSALFVLDGRGITVTAAGRTELYVPLSDEIDQMFAGMQVALTGPSSTTGALDAPTDLSPERGRPE